MAVSSGIITAPVSIGDVATCLGVGSYDLGTLCVSDKINKWSRRKPISLAQIGELTDAQFKSNGFGLTVPTGSTDIFEAAGLEYTYKKPTTYYRLTDFVNYNHLANAACMPASDIVVYKDKVSNYQFMIGVNMSGSDYVIGLAEINPTIYDCYFAVGLRYTYGGKTVTLWRTSSDTIANGATTVNFSMSDPPFSLSTVNSCSVCYAASTTKKALATDAESPSTFYALPFPTASDGQCTLFIKSGTGLTWNFIGLSNSETNPYFDIEMYLYDPLGESNVYYPLNAQGNLYTVWEVRNPTNAAVSMNISTSGSYAMQQQLTPTFASGQSGSTGYVPCKSYLAKDTTVRTDWELINGNVSVPANSSVRIKIGAAGLASYYNNAQMAMSQGKRQCTIMLRYNGTNIGSTPMFNMELK